MGGVDQSIHTRQGMTIEIVGPVDSRHKDQRFGMNRTNGQHQVLGPWPPLLHCDLARMDFKGLSIIPDSKQWHYVVGKRIVRFVEDVEKHGRLLAVAERKLGPKLQGLQVGQRSNKIGLAAAIDTARRLMIEPL